MDCNKIALELGPRLFRYFLAEFPRSRAADMVQETLLRLLLVDRQGKFDPAKGNESMLAFGIARNIRKEALSTWSKDMELRSRVTQNGAATTDESETDDVEALRNAIQELPEVERQVVGLLVDRDLSMEDISGILEMPIGTVKSHIHRAKQALKQTLIRKTGDPHERQRP